VKGIPTLKPVVAPLVAIVMGSQSDWATMKHASDILSELEVGCEARIISAHRTPRRLYAFAEGAKAEGFKVIIAGAGGAAHLPGMVAALTALPVLGVPVESKALSGAINAGLLAASILALADAALAKRLEKWRDKQTASVAATPKDEA
jgi:5-(carboxyamino)imidazole ribonucleotide mutase